MTSFRRWSPWILAAMLALAGWSWLRGQKAIGRAEEAEAEASTAVMTADDAEAALKKMIDVHADSLDELGRIRGRLKAAQGQAAMLRRRARRQADSAGTDLNATRATMRAELTRRAPGLLPLHDSATVQLANERAFRSDHVIALERERDAASRLSVVMASERDIFHAERDSTLAVIAVKDEAIGKLQRSGRRWKDAATGGILPDPFRHLGQAARVVVKVGIGLGAYFACDAAQDGAGKWCGAGYGAAIITGG